MRDLFVSKFVLSLAVGGTLLAFGAGQAQAVPSISPSFHMLDSRHSGAIIHVSSNDKIVEGAENFIIGVTRRGIGFLSDEGMSESDKREAFKKLLGDSFDTKTIGRFSLGRYWRTATAAEQKEYLRLFDKMIVDVYASRFNEYSGERVEVRSADFMGKKDALVTSYIVPDSGPEVRVDWRVRYKDGRYKIVDVIVEGVSMAVTQRSDFASVIQRGGGKVEVLLEHLR